MKTGTKLEESDLINLSNIFKALGEPNRLRIFNLLMQGVHCNCELSHALGMAPNLISHHMRVLRTTGLVDMERDENDARWVYYSTNSQRLLDLNTEIMAVINPDRMQPRQPDCGPRD
jgi:ArsR family transcriptional regulator